MPTHNKKQKAKPSLSANTACAKAIKEIKEIKEKAGQEKNKTTAVLHNFPDGLLFVEKGKISFINSKAREFLRIKGVDCIGKQLSEIKKNKCTRTFIKALEKRKQPFSKIQIDLAEDLFLNVSIVPIVYKDKELGRMIIFHNITRERIIERMKTEFVSIAAHQLRTPLSAVKWIIRMILDGDLGKVPPNQKDFLERAYKSNERMIRLVNDLLNISRIEEGRFLYNLKLEDLTKIVSETIVPFADLARARGLQFEFKKPKNTIPKVKIDTEKIVLVIQNLIENAVNYTKTGGIKIMLKFLKNENKVLFCIKDTGIGLPKAQQKRVFDRFFRSSVAMRTETEGTGLGLFLTKNIIKAHNGEIWFDSKENKGSIFSFTLPVS